MPEHHDHHHGHHGINVKNHHAAELFKRHNTAIFVKEPHITHHRDSTVISCYVTEESLASPGLLLTNVNNPNHRHYIVKQASVAAQNQSQPEYSYFAGTVQKNLDVANTAAVKNGSLTTTLAFPLSQYDPTTGFTNVPKLLNLHLEFYQDITVNH
jgi:hypothetical protein